MPPPLTLSKIQLLRFLSICASQIAKKSICVEMLRHHVAMNISSFILLVSIYINHIHSFLFDSITAELLNRSWWKWYHMKALFMLCVYSHESCWYDLHHGLQGQKGVCHEPPGGLGDRLQGYMGYQQICWDSHMQNILMVGTWHQHHWHQGPKNMGN